jgi:hypothetical protein
MAAAANRRRLACRARRVRRRHSRRSGRLVSSHASPSCRPARTRSTCNSSLHVYMGLGPVSDRGPPLTARGAGRIGVRRSAQRGVEHEPGRALEAVTDAKLEDGRDRSHAGEPSRHRCRAEPPPTTTDERAISREQRVDPTRSDLLALVPRVPGMPCRARAARRQDRDGTPHRARCVVRGLRCPQ